MRPSMIMQDDRSLIKGLLYIQSSLKCIILMIFCLFLLSNGLAMMGENNVRKTNKVPTEEGKRNYALIIESHNWQSIDGHVSLQGSVGKTTYIPEKMVLYQFDFQEEHIVYLGNGQASYEKLFNALSRLTDELKHKDNLFIYFLGKCHFDAIFEKSYFFTSDFFIRNQAQQIHHSVFPDIARKSPYKLDARDFGRWLEKLRVHDTYFVLNASNSSSFLSQVKESITSLHGNRAVHLLALNYHEPMGKEGIDAMRRFHKCFIEVLGNAAQQEVAEVPVARIEEAVGKCIGQVSDNTIISESCRSRAYKGKGFVFVRMMEALEASLRADFRNITEEIEEKRNARELLKGDRAKYINDLLSLKNKAKKHLKSEVFYQEIDAQIVQLGKEIKEIERIERDFEAIGCLAEEKRPMRYKKLYLSVTELSKKPEFASKEMSVIETEIRKKLIETFTIEYERLIATLDNKKLHCLTKRKACKYFLSVFRDFKINDLKVAEITKRSRQYKCSFIEIDLSNSLSLISINDNVNLSDIDPGQLNIKVGHDLNTRILLLKSPMMLIPHISYYRQISSDSSGIIETLNNKELYFVAGRYQSWEAGFDLKWGGYVKNIGSFYIFLGGGYRLTYFSIKFMEDRETRETVYFSELGDKKSFGCFTITTGLVFKTRSFAVTLGFPIFNGKTNSEYNYEIRDASNTISLKPMHFQTKRRLWMGFAIYF